MYKNNTEVTANSLFNKYWWFYKHKNELKHLQTLCLHQTNNKYVYISESKDALEEEIDATTKDVSSLYQLEKTKNDNIYKSEA